VDSRAGMDAMGKRKSPSLRRISNPDHPIVEPIARRYTTELSLLVMVKSSVV
jgi:hypothetical protein